MSSSLRKIHSRGLGKSDIAQGSDLSLRENFDLKSEYYEENIKVSEKLLNSKEDVVTKVKVHKDNGVVEIDARDIKEVIRENKDIKQIVVEKISLEEATRYSLLFAPKDKKDRVSLLADHKDEYLNPYKKEKKVWSISKLEDFVNSDFITGPSQKETLAQPQFLEGEEKIVSETNTNSETSEKKRKFSLRLKSTSEADNHLAPYDDEIDKKLKYQKHTLTKKKNRNKSYYYKAKDHMELYKVGSSYLQDFKSGLKSFSFSSNGIKSEREKTVFGICSFFNYHEDLNICIITESLKNAFYSDICKEFTPNSIPVLDEDLDLVVNSAKGFDLIEYKELKKVERKIKDYDFETFIDYLSDHYDLILWDLPDFKVLDGNKEFYFPIIRSLDNVSFIIKKDISKISEIGEMISYFRRYQVQIKGLLYSSDIETKTKTIGRAS